MGDVMIRWKDRRAGARGERPGRRRAPGAAGRRGRGARAATRGGIALALAGLALGAAADAAAQQGPVELLRERNRTVEAIVESVDGEPTAEQRERLKDLINGLIDFRELSRLALGRHWDERAEREREDFVRVFRELVRNSSVRKLEIYRADSITYRAPEGTGDRVDVATVAHKGRKGVEIVYRMHRVDGEWRVYDMVVDGASTARTYRDSFYREIARGSYDQMYRKLLDRLEEEERA